MNAAMPAPPEARSSLVLLAPTDALSRGFEWLALPLPLPTAPSTPTTQGVPTTRNDAPAGGQMRQGFRIGTLHLMVGYADGSELVELPPTFRLPNAPPWLLGMANLHGRLVPVFDLARHFGLEGSTARSEARKPMLLVLGHGRDAAGIVIDGLPERLRWATGQVADSGTVPEPLTGVVRHPVLVDDTLWFDLDAAALLAELETSLMTLA